MTIGCHPHFAYHLGDTRVEQLTRLAREPNLAVAIGECGLDKGPNNQVPLYVQKKAFRCQLKLALECQLPLVLHIRDAETEARQVLQEMKVPREWPIHRHCFTGSWSDASSWLELYPGSKIGITGLVTFKGASSTHEVVRRIPLERLLLETDAPYFLPSKVPRTGRNRPMANPGHIAHVAAQVATLRNVNIKEVLRANRQNISEVYKV